MVMSALANVTLAAFKLVYHGITLLSYLDFLFKDTQEFLSRTGRHTLVLAPSYVGLFLLVTQSLRAQKDSDPWCGLETPIAVLVYG